MKVKLVGIHRVKKKLADGSEREYFYAWRGGPRMREEPFSLEFTAEYVRLTRDRPDSPYQDAMAGIIKEYQKSPAFLNLKPSTREGYDFAIKAIETDFFDMSAETISAPGTRRLFLEWRDEIGMKHPRKADLYMSVLKRILSFAVDREMITRHPLEHVEKISDGTRRDVIWTDAEIERFRNGLRDPDDPEKWKHKPAPEPLQRALMLALWTGQRQGDLLKLTWNAYDGQAIYLRQGKTGSHVRVKASKELRDCLDSAPRGDAVTILTNSRGKPWTSGFKSSWRKAVAAAGIKDRTFHDLRGTFITLAYREGASIKEIAEVSGHSEKDAEGIIRKHYLVSGAAVERIESRTKTVEDRKTCKPGEFDGAKSVGKILK
ncbi:tyrosine-type recombinase/integrase [Martelella sp. FLE1502]